MAGDHDVAGRVHALGKPDSVDLFITPIDFRFERPDGRAFGGRTMNADNTVVLSINPDFAVQRVFIPALG